VYQGPLLQKHLVAKCTALHTTDKNWHFDVIDWNRDKIPDLVAINRQGQKATEVHVCDGAARYHARLVAKSTGLPKTNANWVFRVVNWDGDGVPDLVAVNRRDGEHTSVHVFSGASDFQDKLLAKMTGLHATNENWSFDVVDWDGDRVPDLVAVNRRDGEHTSVHVFSGASDFQDKLLAKMTGLHATNENWSFDVVDWDGDRVPDLVAVNRRDGEHTSVHVFSGASDFQDKLLAKVTGLHATDENWSFAMVTFAKLPPEATLRKEPIGEHPRRKKDIEAIKELSIKSEDPDPWPGSIFLEKAIFVQSYSDRAIDFTYRVTAVNINYRRETVRTGHAKPGERDM